LPRLTTNRQGLKSAQNMVFVRYCFTISPFLATTNEKSLYKLGTVTTAIFTSFVVTVGPDKGGMAETFEETTDDCRMAISNGELQESIGQVIVGSGQEVFTENVGGNQRVRLDKDTVVLATDLNISYPAVEGESEIGFSIWMKWSS
jgi:hypothetical protein